jgi:hypothetical protein
LEESKRAFTTKRSGSLDPVKDYEPVLYEIVKDPVAANKEREGLSSIQEGFL